MLKLSPLLKAGLNACFLFCLTGEDIVVGFFASAVIGAIWLMAGFAMIFAIKNG